MTDADAIGRLWETKGWPSTRDYHEILTEAGYDLSWSQVVHRLREYCGDLSITDYRARYAEPADDEPPANTDERHAVREDEAGAVAWSIGRRIRTVDDLLEACNIDTDLWEVERHLLNSWEMVSKDGGTQPLLQVKVWLKRRKIRPFEEAFGALLDTVRERAPAVPALVKPDTGEYLFVPSILDTHFGVLSADGEYTLRAAEMTYNRVADALISRATSLDMPISRILLPVDNDAFHTDNLNGTTTSGTWVQQNADIRDTIMAVCRATSGFIDKLMDIAPVDVIAVAGNHSRLNSFWLSLYLDAWYHKTARVTVNIDKSPRKYYRFGTTLLGLTHGDKIKPERMVVTMATEAPPEDWAASTYREFLTGHLHRKANMHYSGIEEAGINVRVLPALVPPDNWHKLHGFVGNNRAATALFYHNRYGPAGEFPVYVEDAAPAAARLAA